MKHQFVEGQRANHTVKRMCAVLGVSRSGHYAWRARQPSIRQKENEELFFRIQAIHEQSRRLYGSPRIRAELNAQGFRCGKNRVARIMRDHALRADVRRRRFRRTTDSRHDLPVADNLLHQDFTTATAPNEVWLSDLTYIPTGEGWLYLAGVMDLFSRKIVGWSMAEHLRTDLVSEALRMAIARRQPGAGLLHHSDRGIQYASDAYQQLLQAHRMEASMSRRGDCWDNACAESFWGTLKTELVNHEHYASRDAARQSIFEYIEVFYNRNRLHSSLGYQSPEAFEASLN